jgi:hypothetical protein
MNQKIEININHSFEKHGSIVITCSDTEGSKIKLRNKGYWNSDYPSKTILIDDVEALLAIDTINSIVSSENKHNINDLMWLDGWTTTVKLYDENILKWAIEYRCNERPQLMQYINEIPIGGSR